MWIDLSHNKVWCHAVWIHPRKTKAETQLPPAQKTLKMELRLDAQYTIQLSTTSALQWDADNPVCLEHTVRVPWQLNHQNGTLPMASRRLGRKIDRA
jgi:hypothetical protein